jgi:hypothetical protein
MRFSAIAYFFASACWTIAVIRCSVSLLPCKASASSASTSARRARNSERSNWLSGEVSSAPRITRRHHSLLLRPSCAARSRTRSSSIYCQMAEAVAVRTFSLFRLYILDTLSPQKLGGATARKPRKHQWIRMRPLQVPARGGLSSKCIRCVAPSPPEASTADSRSATCARFLMRILTRNWR